MNNHKKPERRTFLQDRFDILIKRQKTGEATFNELTELDDIVNRDPEIREKVIRENLLMENADEFDEPSNDADAMNDLPVVQLKRKGFFTRLKAFLARIFFRQISGVKDRISTYYTNQAFLV
jgi:hypothetical protein